MNETLQAFKRGHPERSEGPHAAGSVTQCTMGDLGCDWEVLRLTQDDILGERWASTVER
jgi:hypothetical protein